MRPIFFFGSDWHTFFFKKNVFKHYLPTYLLAVNDTSTFYGTSVSNMNVLFFLTGILFEDCRADVRKFRFVSL